MIQEKKSFLDLFEKFSRGFLNMVLAVLALILITLLANPAQAQNGIRIRDKATEGALSGSEYILLDRADYTSNKKSTTGYLKSWVLEDLAGGEFYDDAYDGSRTVSNTDLAAYGGVIGGTTLKEFLDGYFFKAEAPVANIAVYEASILEMGSSNAREVDWNVGVRTNPIASVVVNGATVTGTSGRQSVTLNQNVTNTITITATDSEGLTGTDNCTFYYRHAYYWGSMPDVTNISDADIRTLDGAASGIGKALDTNRQKDFAGINGGGEYLVFAFPQSWGSPVFIVANLPNTAFTRVRNDNYINSFGYSEPYQVWVSNTKYNSSVSNFEIE